LGVWDHGNYLMPNCDVVPREHRDQIMGKFALHYKNRIALTDEQQRLHKILKFLLVTENVLKRRRECGTYLATARRHHRRLKMKKRYE
jgi:hypothetical protein